MQQFQYRIILINNNISKKIFLVQNEIYKKFGAKDFAIE